MHEETGKAYAWQDTQDTHMHGNVNLKYKGKSTSRITNLSIKLKYHLIFE